MNVQHDHVAQGQPGKLALHAARRLRRFELCFVVSHRLGRKTVDGIVILVIVAAGGAQVITHLQAFISANVEVNLTIAAEV